VLDTLTESPRAPTSKSLDGLADGENNSTHYDTLYVLRRKLLATIEFIGLYHRFRKNDRQSFSESHLPLGIVVCCHQVVPLMLLHWKFAVP
jgi:hypothetical protein